MPLETQKHPKMPWNSMFSFPKTPNRSKKSIFGRVVFLANFWVVIFPVFDKFWSQNGLPKLLGVLTFGIILEFKTLFLRPPHFFSIFLAKMLKKCWNSIPINWKAHRMESKFDSQSYARLTDLPKGSYPPLPHQTATWTGALNSSQSFVPPTTLPTLQIKRGRAVARLCRYNYYYYWFQHYH